jgi:hypothetical protein
MSTDTDRFLPDLLREIRDDWDLDTAIKFAERFGGTVTYVPQTVKGGAAIAETMGEPFLAWLVERRAGRPTVVPLGPHSSYRKRIQFIRALLKEGRPVNEIVRLAKCHERTVRRHQSALQDNSSVSSQGQFGF